jgi:hypothetical protein
MPNWCENTLEIWGDEEDMKEFYDFFGGQDKLQDLNQNMDMIIGMIGETSIGELSGTSMEMLE